MRLANGFSSLLVVLVCASVFSGCVAEDDTVPEEGDPCEEILLKVELDIRVVGCVPVRDANYYRDQARLTCPLDFGKDEAIDHYINYLVHRYECNLD